MFLTTLKYLQLLSALVLTGLFVAAPALMPVLYPDVFPTNPGSRLYTQEPALLILLAAASANLMAGCYQSALPGARRPLQSLASLAMFASGVLAAANAFGRLYIDPAAALSPLIAVALIVAGLGLHILCNLHMLKPTAATNDQNNELVVDHGREAGTVKWFNVSKGFGFITRDSGEDIFVHYRAIRGEGHRTLSEGQRVHFVVAEKEKGLQAEDVASS